MQPLISVVIPCYKSAATVRQTIDSVLDQTNPRVEVIVINDGSPENEREIALSYGDRIRYIEQENGGVSSARNRGLQEATGEFVHFLDADDFVVKDSYQIFMDFLAENPDADVMYSNWIFADDGGNPVDKIRSEKIEGDVALELFKRNRLANLATISRLRMVKEVGGFDKNIQGSEDWDLWIRLARHGAKIMHVDKYTCVHRFRTGSLSKCFMPMWKSLRSIQTKHRDLVQGLPNADAIIREQVEDLLDRDLRHVYGSDQDKMWIQRRLNRIGKIFYLSVQAPELVPHILRRAYRGVGRRLKFTS